MLKDPDDTFYQPLSYTVQTSPVIHVANLSVV